MKYQIAFTVVVAMVSVNQLAQSAELPPELPLWGDSGPALKIELDAEEQVVVNKVAPHSLSGSNRMFSAVSSPTYSIHRPEKPNDVGLVVCPGGGFRHVWIDREGHDLAVWLKERGVTCLVLKYRTRPENLESRDAWSDYQRAVRSDGWQAVRVLREQSNELGLKRDKIGICGFSAGGHLALSCAIHPEPDQPKVSGAPDFAGLFYPGIPDDVGELIESRASDICPMFIMNARVDKLTPAEKCVDFYAALLKAGVEAELHIYAKGSHGFDMAVGRGKSVETWPTSFAAWLRDCGMVED